MFYAVIDVLELIMENSKSEQKAKASNLLDSLKSFDVAFSLHLMRNILGITYELSQALQRKDQDIVNAMTLVKISKQWLHLLQLVALDNQLETYILDTKSNAEFSNLTAISNLAEKNVKDKKESSVERAFSAMKIVKNQLRNRMGDQ
ncbi:uncharacterized protein LOC131181633 [Hevea brasiliensis]|uniref:uncharacterized protein LOC131181633 n=1 Tax=Hevea brasiliensis TaxID=3981 RepID=UPI0025D5C8A0|nr:uncharacterized protein LOC131181633 [Hevea brasiliensis]